MQAIKERIITINEAYTLLKERQKQGNLSYEQQNTLNYLEDLCKLDNKDAAKMVKELVDAGLSEWQAVKALDLLPKKEEELKTTLAGSGALNDASLKKAFEVVKEYRKAAKEPAKTKKIEPAPVPTPSEATEQKPGAEPESEKPEEAS